MASTSKLVRAAAMRVPTTAPMTRRNLGDRPLDVGSDEPCVWVIRSLAPPSEQRINERCHRAALGQHGQTAKNEHGHENRKQPEFLADAQEFPDFTNQRQHRLVSTQRPPRPIKAFMLSAKPPTRNYPRACGVSSDDNAGDRTAPTARLKS